jgi:hypothetical protein
MSTTVNTTFKLKRGTAARWAEVNPVLELGEPGFVYDENRLKIGDGKTPWNDLPYIGGNQDVYNFDSADVFPEIGDSNIIYKAEKEQSLYQFNSSTGKYEKLSDGKGVENISIINGGTANG